MNKKQLLFSIVFLTCRAGASTQQDVDNLKGLKNCIMLNSTNTNLCAIIKKRLARDRTGAQDLFLYLLGVVELLDKKTKNRAAVSRKVVSLKKEQISFPLTDVVSAKKNFYELICTLLRFFPQGELLDLLFRSKRLLLAFLLTDDFCKLQEKTYDKQTFNPCFSLTKNLFGGKVSKLNNQSLYFIEFLAEKTGQKRFKELLSGGTPQKIQQP